MSRLQRWMRIALIDLRGDLRRFGILLACLALGTGTIAMVGSVGAALQGALVRDATRMMGGDLEATRADRPANPEEVAFLQTFGPTTETIDTNGRAEAGENGAFLDIYAVGDNYPLVGNVLSPELPLGEKPFTLLAKQNGVWGAIVDTVLLDRLGIGLGGQFTIGAVPYQIRGILDSVPDGAVRGFHLGLTTLISTEALAENPDARSPLPGLLTQHRYKVLLDGRTYEEASAAILQRFNDPEWSVRSPRDAAGTLARYYDLFTKFLLIVGLSSLLVGGVGVSNGVSAYIGERQRSIATMRSLGATDARISTHFLTQVGILAAIGVGLGLLAGAISTLLVLPTLGRILNVDLPPNVNLLSLLSAALFGLLAAFAFSYLPLVRAQQLRPALLFRSVGTSLQRPNWRTMLRPRVFVPLVLVTLAIFGLAVLTTGDLRLVLYYAVGVVLAFLLLRGAGWLLQLVLRVLPRMPSAKVRAAFRNIYRPGSPAPVVIMSLGLGLAMLLVIAILQSNLHSQLLGEVQRDAPTLVATDLFEEEAQELQNLQQTNPIVTSVLSSPMLRGQVRTVRGIPATDFKNVGGEVAFMLRDEIPITWRPDLPADTTVTAGEWWPADYSGPPLISMHDIAQTELGLKIGDTVEIEMYGEMIEAKVANFRDYQFQNGINFMVTFSPGALDEFPTSYLATIKAAEGEETNLERLMAREFPEVTFIPIGDALNQAANILEQLSTAVGIVGGLAVINGLLVLAGTMAAGRKQRESDAVVNKVLGATRGDVVRIFALEYGLLGGFAAAIATLVGIAGAYTIITRAGLQIGFGVDPVLIIEVIIGAVALTIVTGAATTWRALSTKPAQYLRSLG